LFLPSPNPLKNKSQKVGVFFVANLAPSSHHVFTTKSPEITTQTPRFLRTISQNPLEKQGNHHPKIKA
jgi:hypothetical protein